MLVVLSTGVSSIEHGCGPIEHEWPVLSAGVTGVEHGCDPVAELSTGL